MIKLKQIITQLDPLVYNKLAEEFKNNKGNNFLHLLQAYRQGGPPDNAITESLGISPNSLYVLKSRLADKIQKSLVGNIFEKKETLLTQINRINELLFNGPPEITETFLLKLEADLLEHHMHNELLPVYSALKKVNKFSQRYYHYSQLYNRHAAFNLALEKSEELLLDFNRVLAEYDFSRSKELIARLQLVINDINLINQLNPSKQTELIKNIANIELYLFTHIPEESWPDLTIMLRDSDVIIKELPENSPFKNWNTVLDFLYHEYHRKTGNVTAASEFFTHLNRSFKNLLLYSGICPIGKFLYYRLSHQGNELQDDTLENEQVYYNESDTHCEILLSIYQAHRFYMAEKYKDAAKKLNQVLNSTSLKDLLHINIEIRLNLAIIYLQMNEYDLCEQLLKNVLRKIKTLNQEKYRQIPHLIKILNTELNKPIAKKKKVNDEFTLFLARNKGEYEVLHHLLPALKEKYHV